MLVLVVGQNLIDIVQMEHGQEGRQADGGRLQALSGGLLRW